MVTNPKSPVSAATTVAGALVRDAFGWLEDEGFQYLGEKRRYLGDPRRGLLQSTSTFERGPVAVLIHWDRMDGMTWTVVARGSPRLRWLPGRHLGLGHLEPALPNSADTPIADPEVDPAPLRAALDRDSSLLRTRGFGLLSGSREAWTELARLQGRSD